MLTRERLPMRGRAPALHADFLELQDTAQGAGDNPYLTGTVDPWMHHGLSMYPWPTGKCAGPRFTISWLSMQDCLGLIPFTLRQVGPSLWEAEDLTLEPAELV